MNKSLIQVSLLVAVCALIFLVASATDGTFLNSQPKSLETYAARVIAICEKESYPPKCYDIEIPKLMDSGLSLEEAFEVTKIVQEKVHGYFYCHVLGHNLSAKETAKDPSKWTQVVARCPTGMCSNGCLHGAAQERFRAESLTREQTEGLVPELSHICDSGNGRDFTGLERASCVHALGHLSMYITGADVPRASELCEKIVPTDTNSEEIKLCYEGLYMQIFQPLEPEDFALVKDIPAKTQDEARAFCGSFDVERKDACNRESWPLYRDDLGNKGALESFCSLASDANSEQRCFSAIFYVLTAQYGFDLDRIVPLCKGLSEKRKAQCFANAASRLIETDYRLTPKALEVCKVAEEDGVGKRCYDELLFYSSYNFHKGSEALRTLCEGLPEPWKSTCVKGGQNMISPSQEDI